MKYRNKYTGVIVEAMQIKYGMERDILDFGDGLINKVESGVSSGRSDLSVIELTPQPVQCGEPTPPFSHYISCLIGDYLIKKDTYIFVLREGEFKEQFETIEEENSNMKINLNDEVKVRLTDDALEILKENHKALNRIILKNGGKPDKFPYKPDENGYYTFQLWHLFEDFGKHISCGCESPFINNEIIPETKECETIEADERTITKDMFDPVEKATTTLKQHECTIKDCMIDMIMEEKAEELRKKFFKYLTLKLNELHEEIQKGGNNSAPRRAEDYKKLVECRRSICNMSIKDFLNCSEKDFCQLFGFGPNKTFNYLMEDIHYETEFNKEKDNEQNI